MPQVSISINQRTYTLECAPGQEEHLRNLARMVNKELDRIRGSAGPVGELRLLIMASLVIADKVVELERELSALRQQVEQLREENTRAAAAGDLLQAVRDATTRLDRLAGKDEGTEAA